MTRVRLASALALAVLLIMSSVLANPVDELRVQPGGGTDAWDRAVGPILLAGWDRDGSGWIDTAAEVEAVPCSAYRALDDGVRERFTPGVRMIYGFDASAVFVADALGFHESVRDTTNARLIACEASWSDLDRAVDVAPSSTIVDRLRAIPAGGTTEWDRAVRRVALRAWDTDGSGWIDRPAELAPISCATWSALDDGVRQRWDASMRLVYGFAEDRLWVGSALGVSERVRTEGDQALKRCLEGTDDRGANQSSAGPPPSPDDNPGPTR